MVERTSRKGTSKIAALKHLGSMLIAAATVMPPDDECGRE